MVRPSFQASRVIYLARHGETDWNAQGRWQGHTDVPLNAAGKEQAQALAAVLVGVPPAGIVSSDLSRASETGRIVARALKVPFLYEDPDLRERAFGPFEGLTREECERLHPEAWSAWLEERRVPPGAESLEALALRMAAALGRVVERVGQEGGTVLVVSHGGAMRAAITSMAGKTPPPIANGGLWRMTWDGETAEAEPFA
jgi:probable phosphoglycerate mutase